MKLLPTVTGQYINPAQVQVFSIREDAETGKFVVEATLAAGQPGLPVNKFFNTEVDAVTWLYNL